MSLRDEGRGFGITNSNLKRVSVAIKDNLAALPDVTAEKEDLDSAISDAEEAIRRKDFHVAQSRQASKDVKAALGRGLDIATRLQNAVRFKLGFKDERLLEFQLKPRGKRTPPSVKRAQEAEQKNEVLLQENVTLKEQLAKSEVSSKDESKGDKAT